MIRKEGIGSYFHFENIQSIKSGLSKNHIVDLNFDYQLFYTGRHALLYILNEISVSKNISKIWFPNYYCQHTINWMKKLYSNIHTYEINPFDFSSDIINLSTFSNSNDVVIINNYWGLSSMHSDKNKSCSPLIIEDHSLGWLSNKCLNSTADYCFASIRKSLPIPLGGIYWKPNSTTSNNTNENIFHKKTYKAWDDMLEAMMLKSTYISSSTGTKNVSFLSKYHEVEKFLNNNTETIELTNNHKEVLNSYLIINTKKIKEENLVFLYTKIHKTTNFKVVKRKGYTAFGLHLLFKDKKMYDSLKLFLISNTIYPSTLWPDNVQNYEWRYFLNIHTDYRYTIEDFNYIILKINEWIKNHTK